MSHAELEQLAAGYVLGSLEPDDEHEFIAHLDTCLLCRSQVAGLEGVVGELAFAAPRVAPPRGLRASLRRQIGLTRRRRGLLAFRVRLSRPVAIAAGVGLVLLVVLALSFANMSLRYQVALEQRQLGELRAAVSQLVDPRARLVRLAAPTGGRGHGTVATSVETGTGVLVVEGLASPGVGRVYQLWAVRPGGDPVRATPGRVWTSAGPVATIRFDGLPVEPGTSFIVTVEPRGGSTRPTLPPVLQGGS